MKFLPTIRYRRNLAAGYDTRKGSKLLSGRIAAGSTNSRSETSDGTMRPLNSREAA